MANKNLTAAKRAKNDEFYTRLTDVEKELIHYRPHFKDKTVFLNCDDPTYSAFWRHFHKLFAVYGLKKLIATHYEYDENVHSYAMVYEGGSDNDVSTGIRIELEGNGDFRSDGCIEFLKESDIVVTNPPFSLFREYVAQLVEYGKKFLIIGNMNAITYKEIFPLLKDGVMWLGNKSLGSEMYFHVSSEYQNWLRENKTEGSAYKIVNNELMGRMAAACWFTNLDIKKRHEELFLSSTYYKKDGFVPQASLDRWPHYDNYDAIEVSKVKDIPVDYAGVMGVPITFLDKYNPEQFEIIKFRKGDDDKDLSVNGKCPYFRILIRARHTNPSGGPCCV